MTPSSIHTANIFHHTEFLELTPFNIFFISTPYPQPVSVFHKCKPNQRVHQNLIQFAGKKIWITIHRSAARVLLLVASYCRAISIKLLMPSINTHRSLGKRWLSSTRGERCISGYDTLQGWVLESFRGGVWGSADRRVRCWLCCHGVP